MSAPTTTRFSTLLYDVLNYTEDEFVSLGYCVGSGPFRTAVKPPRDAIAAATRLPGNADCYFGVNPTAGPARQNAGRGDDASVTRLAALVCDLDVKPGACKSLDVALAIVANLSILLNTRPSVLVYSGGGLHAYWPISDGHTAGDIRRVRALLRRWGRLVAVVADSLNVKVDTVYDPARMMRLPGSTNRKTDEPRPVVAERDNGGPLTLDELAEYLDEAGITENDSDAADGDAEVLSPPDGWQWGERTCAYVAAMLGGLAEDTPKNGRNPWLLSQKVRLACAHRLGCITESDYRAAITALERRFTEIVQSSLYGTPREPKRFEFRDTSRCAIRKAAAKTDDQARAELGNHTHPAGADAETGELRPTDAHRGQARMAYRLAERYDGRLLHVTGLGWHWWDGTRYALDERGAATRAVLAELRRGLADSLTDKELRADVRKCESASGVAGVLNLAAALPQFGTAVDDLDADPYLLNVANGTLDLRTLEMHPHCAADRITKLCRAAYLPGVQSTLWEAFLERVLPDDAVRGFVQRLVGAALLGAVREHVLPIFTGRGANGKGTFERAVRWTLGDYAGSAEPDLFMHRAGGHPTGEMDLLGLRLVVVSESDRDRHLAEATMKRLTGGDTIRARRMRQDFVEFTPSHTALLVTNHLPRVSGDDPAIWRRLRVVPFNVEIPLAEQDGQLDERLQLEADGILAWAVAGWQQYNERGLDEPDTVRAATDDYQRASDTVARFVDECCVTSSPALKATTAQLFDAFEKWRAVDGAEPLSLKSFGQTLTAKGYPAAKPSNGKKWRHGIAVSTALDDSDDD